MSTQHDQDVPPRDSDSPTEEQEFTALWFEGCARPTWELILPIHRPTRILEVGSYEGASTCFCIRTLAPLVDRLEIHCVDTWAGGQEHQIGASAEADMSAVEERFHRNTRIEIERAAIPVDLVCHRQESRIALAKLIAEGRSGWFDFVYVDGSHQAPDVLIDAVLAHQLVRKGGVIAFDDYLWSEHTGEMRDPLGCPKLAIDAYTNIFFRKVEVVSAPLYQLYVNKIAD